MNPGYQPFQPLLTPTAHQHFGLSVREHPATKRMAGIVHSYLQVRATGPTRYPIIPDGTQALFIGIDSVRIGGANTQALDIPIPRAGDYFGIRFYPGALHHFFKLNLSEITNQMVDSRYLTCNDSAELCDRIYDRTDFIQRARICEDWLLRHFVPQAPSKSDLAMQLIYLSFGNIRISALAEKIGASGHHLNQLFRQRTGLTTKAFSRIIRIQRVAKALHENPKCSLALSAELGFYDQAHLLNEYKRHLLSNPHSIFQRFSSDFYNTEHL
ncbi:helix-turn-helix domain-containing protein [Acidihalobacter yilgarnensis]|nr:helix-turn-helix domain-containing protein [Acidihalobacter yilgarnensis]